MCLPLREEYPVIAYEAPRALHRAVALFTLIVLVALTDYLRPDTSFTPGVPVGVDVLPPQDSTSTPPFTFPVWRPR
jgi:hypothetical protein